MEKDENDTKGKDGPTEGKEEDMRDDTDDILTDKITNEEMEEEVIEGDTQGESGSNLSHKNQTDNEVEPSEETKETGELEASNTADIEKLEVCDEVPPIPDHEREKREKQEKAMSDYMNLALPKRPRSMIKSELLVKDVKKFIEDMKKQTAPDDMDVRIIPSNMACRFELPIDLTRLKGECPLSYLKKYCRITDSRQAVYKEKFHFYSLEQTVTVSDLRNIYENMFHESTLHDEVMHLQRLLGLDLSMELDVETFTVVSCLMERIMLKSQGKGPAQEYKKNIFEVTNFSALNGKLQGIDISPEMMNLLKYIRGT